MKKIFLLLCLFGALSLTAQHNRYGVYVGGTLGFSSAKSNIENSQGRTKWSFSPEFGFYPVQQLSVGINLLMDGVSQGDYTTNSFGSGLYCRKFFGVTDNFSIFIGLNGSYKTTTAKQIYQYGTVKDVENSVGAFFDLGLSYKMSEKWSILGRLGTLGYNKTSNPDNPDYGEKVFGINLNALGNPFSVGVLYKF